jgi:eukaryotic-like serine/threonine-protein kinase
MSETTRPSTSRSPRRYRSTPSDPVAARAFFQTRVRNYIGYALVIWAMAFLSDRAYAAWRFGSVTAAPNQLYLWAHYVVIALNGTLYGLIRARVWGPRALRAMELVATLAQALCSATLLAQLPLSTRPEFLSLFAATLFLILRAGLVPGSVSLALVVGTLAIAPSIVVARLLYSQPSVALEGGLDLTNATFFSIEWGAMALAATTAIHAVIYGLEERVHELGQYTLLHPIGEGGMGVVYRARHALLRRPTAVKLLPLEKTSPAGVARFEREVQLTSELAHPNIVSVYDFGKSSDGSFYYAMEYLEGVDLQRLVEAHGAQSEARVVHLLRQAADALAEAHQIGLVHRDIKPANLFLSNPPRRPDHLTVLDFGLATQFSGDPSQSAAGEIRGTPLYMAPETIRDATRADERSDVYALGAVAYFLLTGTPPFSRKTVVEVCAAHLHAEPEPPSARLGTTISAELEGLVLACLAKTAEQRPRTAAELLERLGAVAVPRWSADEARSWWKANIATARQAYGAHAGPRTITVATSEGRA